MDITYEPFLGGIRVKLDGRRVGVIQTTKGGYQYMPNGGKIGGEIFATVNAVKASLES
jgi:hypothetical protein